MTTGNILFTSDWQMRASNLPLIETLVTRLHDIISTENVQTVVHCGDVKDPLNPVDLRITNAAVRALTSFKLRGVETYVLKGNHDAGSYADAVESWLPTLQAAGALTVEQPCSVAHDSITLHFVPYRRDVEDVKSAIAGLKLHKKATNLLVLHASIEGAYENDTRLSSADAVPRSCLTSFDYVVSGHIHLPQCDKDKRIWFVGSPFSMGWGEVNQRKRVLIYNPIKSTFKAVWLDLPGHFEPGKPGFPANLPAGSVVKVHCRAVDGESEASTAVAAREKAKEKYAGCEIVVDVETPKDDTVTVEAHTDAEAIAAYVKQAVPEHLQSEADAITGYLEAKLTEAEGALRQSLGIELVSIKAKNVLSYETMSYQYSTGLTVVTGENGDWGGRSNGAGKTNFLQLPLIALFGKTAKGQTAEDWRREGSSGDCWVKLVLRVAGHEVEIMRGRSPKGVRVMVDGEDQTRGKDHETQRQIEEITGLTWDVAVTALWIDQRKANKLLHGQDAERKAILSQFLNLERFARAVIAIKFDRDRRAAALEAAKSEAAGVVASIETLRAALASVATDADTLTKAKAELAARKEKHRSKEERARAQINANAAAIQRQQAQVKELERKRDIATSKSGGVAHAIEELERQLYKAQKQSGAECPTCGAPLDTKAVQVRITELQGQIEEAAEERLEIKARIRMYRDKIAIEEKSIAELQYSSRELTTEIVTSNHKLKDAQTAVDTASKLHDAMQGTRSELAKAEERAEVLVNLIVHHSVNLDMDKFSVAAFSKSGVPAFLMARLCPRLNRAARRYSKLVSDGVIQVQFSIDERQDVAVSVINSQGGADVAAQSVGETTSAVLVVALALRDIMLPCNALIADEPGDGLDESGARALAAVLRNLTGTYKSVLVTTHNPHIMAELSDCRSLTIKKSDKVSKLTK